MQATASPFYKPEEETSSRIDGNVILNMVTTTVKPKHNKLDEVSGHYRTKGKTTVRTINDIG